MISTEENRDCENLEILHRLRNSGLLTERERAVSDKAIRHLEDKTRPTVPGFYLTV